jgi:hypothetical protein
VGFELRRPALCFARLDYTLAASPLGVEVTPAAGISRIDQLNGTVGPYSACCVEYWPVSVAGVILGRVEAHNPAWVPGEAELERLLDARPGPYGDLPPGVGPLLEVTARLIARAFAAFAEDDLETCDALVAEGVHACGDVFTGMVEHIASPGWPYRVDSSFWEDFVARLTTAVLRPTPAPAPPPHPVESHAAFLERLSQVRADAEARHGTGRIRTDPGRHGTGRHRADPGR